MTMRDSDRPLLVGGEHLRLEIESSRQGGGEKFHPFTVAEATVNLRPQLKTLERSIRDLPDHLRGSQIIFQTTLLPNYLAASYFPSKLLEETGLVAVGSRPAEATHITPTTSTPATTKSVIVAGPPESIDRFQRLLSAEPVLGKSLRNAQEQLRELSDIRLATAEEILGIGDRPAEVWEAVLHPRGVGAAGELLPLDDATFTKWGLARQRPGRRGCERLPACRGGPDIRARAPRSVAEGSGSLVQPTSGAATDASDASHRDTPAPKHRAERITSPHARAHRLRTRSCLRWWNGNNRNR